MAMNQHKLLLLCRPARRRSTLKVLMTSSALIAASVCGAQAQTWNVDANGNWGTAGNWTPATVPNSFNATATLGAAITADRTITLDAPITLNTLNFQNPAHSYTIASLSGASTLTFAGGFSASLNSTATASQTIAANVVLDTTFNANIGASADVTITGGVSGANWLNKNGAGTLTLSGIGSYTGFTNINAGTLRAGAANAFAPASSTTVAAGATLDLNSYNQAIGSLAGAGNITLGSANLTIRGSNTTFSGQISGDGGSLTSFNSGSLRTVLTGDNTYTGGTRVSSGQLQVGDFNAAGGAIIGAATIDNGALLILYCNNAGEGGKCNGSTTGSGSFSGPITNNGTLQTAGHGTLTFSREISGAGILAPTQGLTVLTANNSYTGGTFASNGGTLQVGVGGTTGSMGTGEVSVFALTFNRSNELIVDNLLSGTGTVTQAGSGPTILTANNTYSGGTTINTGGTLQAGAGGETGALGSGQSINNGTLIVNRSNDYSINQTILNNGLISNIGAGATTLNGRIVGTGSLSTTAGTLILNGLGNTFSGGATIAAGSTLKSGVNGGNSALGSGNIVNDGALVLESINLFVPGAISGAGSLTQSSGRTTLTGTNSYTGGTTVSGGTLKVGDTNVSGAITGPVTIASGAGLLFVCNTAGGGGACNGSTSGSGIFSGTIVNNGTLQTQGGGVLNLSGAITGGGRLVTEQGTTVLTADNSYAGGTQNLSGKLQVGDGGTTGSLGTGDASFSNLVFNRSNQLIVGNRLSGGTVNQIGSGTTILSAENDYTGWTSVAAGTLQVGNGGSTGSMGNTPGITVSNGATLDIRQSDVFILNPSVDGAGSLRQSGSGTTIIPYDKHYTGGTSITAGTLQIGNGWVFGDIYGDVSTETGATLAFNRYSSETFSGVISGGGAVHQIGVGALTLTGDNSYSGGTIIDASRTLQIGAGGATGALGDGPVRDDGSLIFNRTGVLTVRGAISGTGTVKQDGPGTTVLTNENIYFGDTTIAEGALQLGEGGDTGTLLNTAKVDVQNGAALSFNRGNTLEFDRFITGVGKVNQAGAGTTVLTANNDYTGGTTINAGALQLGNGGTSGTILGNVTNNGALSFNRSNTLTFGGVISGIGAVTQDGVGTTALTADNTYAGGTTITAGTLQIGAGGTTGALVNTAQIDVRDGGALSFNRSNTLVFDRFITGDGKVSQDGAGKTTLTANNDYRGGTTITAGTLQLGNGGTTGSIKGDVSTLAGGTLSFNRSNTLVCDGAISGAGKVTQNGVGANGVTVLTADNSYTGGTTISAGTLQIGNGGASGTLGSGPVLDNGVLAINRAGVFDILGAISGSGRLDKMGPGTAILTANNTYTGGTTISGGALQLGNGGTTGAILGDVSTLAGGTLAINRSNTLTFGGLITGAGKVTQDGVGTTVLTADNTYTGGTTISAGMLQLGNGGTTGAIAGDVTNNGVLSFNRSYQLVFDGKITGSGSVIQDGVGFYSGTVLTANNDYRGGTTISHGTLYLGDGGTSGAILGDVSTLAGGALGFDRSDRLVFDGKISGGGAVEQFGDGTTALTGDSDYAGGTSIYSGVLQLGDGGTTGAITGDVWTGDYPSYATARCRSTVRMRWCSMV